MNPAAVSEGSTALDFAKLTKTLKQYDGALGELYAAEPDKMNALRRAQRLLEPLATRAGAAAGGTPGRVLEGADYVWKLLEIGLKAHFGVLKGGGVLGTIRVASSLFDSPAAANQLVARMMFDPELAGHLLTREVKEVGSPAWTCCSS